MVPLSEQLLEKGFGGEGLQKSCLEVHVGEVGIGRLGHFICCTAGKKGANTVSHLLSLLNDYWPGGGSENLPRWQRPVGTSGDKDGRFFGKSARGMRAGPRRGIPGQRGTK